MRICISNKFSLDVDGACGGAHFENHCSTVLIKYCLASLKELGIENNHILLFQAGKLEAYVDVVFCFVLYFPEHFGYHWYFECSSHWDLHPIIEDWYIESFFFLVGSLSGSWHAGVCTGKVVGFIQFTVFTGSYVTILVNGWSQKTWKSSFASVCWTPALCPWTNHVACLDPGLSSQKWD